MTIPSLTKKDIIPRRGCGFKDGFNSFNAARPDEDESNWKTPSGRNLTFHQGVKVRLTTGNVIVVPSPEAAMPADERMKAVWRLC